MYLEHFGLNESPFRITPVTEFFFSGANRGEILDALIYSISEAEGIIKVSGEVGSGKTMLCRMLLERLPEHIETIYLANPSLSREEMLYAIADGLGLDIGSERIGVIMQNIQTKLEEKARDGKLVVVLVDEAHAMPPDTLEELRLLYNLQVGNFKLLQIILFGQPELNDKLNQPNMRQLKDRIVHHFNMQPLSRNVLESYLMFRMRAAGYHGPNVFSQNALKLIARASDGLMRRVNILADKSLLSAFVEDTHNIEARHVQAAMRDSELQPAPALSSKKIIWLASGAALLFGIATWWAAQNQQKIIPPSNSPDVGLSQLNTPPVPIAPSVTAPQATASTESMPSPSQTQASAPITLPPPQTAATNVAVAPSVNTSKAVRNNSLFEQRLAAGKQLLEQKQTAASIQLFYNEEINITRMEGFLKRAEQLGKIPEIYLLPARLGGKNGLRVLYGTYSSAEAARNAIKELPPRYQEAFTTTIYTF